MQVAIKDIENDVTAAIEAVEANRGRMAIVQMFLQEDERREKIRTTLRNIYAEQGEDISATAVEMALANVERDRFAYVNPLPSSKRWFWEIYAKWPAVTKAVHRGFRGVVGIGVESLLLLVVLGMIGGVVYLGFTNMPDFSRSSSFSRAKATQSNLDSEAKTFTGISRQIDREIAAARRMGADEDRIDRIAKAAKEAVDRGDFEDARRQLRGIKALQAVTR